MFYGYPMQNSMSGYGNNYGNGYATTQQNTMQQSQQIARLSYVTCIDEAKAAQIPLDGSITVFVNVQNGEIYTKQLDNNGLADLKLYRRIQNVAQQNVQYVPVQDFNALTEKVKMLESRLMGGVNNVSESNANNGNDAK
jgi:hypothetical protein|nr:MAG TPA: hypothetical protein [Caudoviricetes sp.]